MCFFHPVESQLLAPSHTQIRCCLLQGFLGPDRRLWALSRGSCALQCSSGLISECAGSGPELTVGRGVGMHHMLHAQIVWCESPAVQPAQELWNTQWVLQPVGFHVACSLDKQRKHKNSLLVLLCGVQRHHSLQQLRPVIMNKVLLPNRILMLLIELSGASSEKQGVLKEPI